MSFIGNIIISDLEVIVVEDSRLDFGVDEHGNDLKIDGFLGWYIIQNFSWKVDRINNDIEVSNSVQTEKDKNLFPLDCELKELTSKGIEAYSYPGEEGEKQRESRRGCFSFSDFGNRTYY